jgi:hypothetical protein
VVSGILLIILFAIATYGLALHWLKERTGA